MTDPAQALLQQMRAFIYQRMVEAAKAPSLRVIARRFELPRDAAASACRQLEAAHALLLEPGTARIRMVPPFSAVPTPFRVRAGALTYWANCGFDALGIPAALQANATIEAACAAGAEPVILTVRGRRLLHGGEVVHFLVPFRHWHDDLIHT